MKEKHVNADLFRESLLLPGDEKHVIEKDDKHLGSFSRVKKLKGSLHQDLPEKFWTSKTTQTKFKKNENCCEKKLVNKLWGPLNQNLPEN